MMKNLNRFFKTIGQPPAAHPSAGHLCNRVHTVANQTYAKKSIQVRPAMQRDPPPCLAEPRSAALAKQGGGTAAIKRRERLPF
jgi:hypothetical protein